MVVNIMAALFAAVHLGLSVDLLFIVSFHPKHAWGYNSDEVFNQV
jgi:hypothetical protein